jgi:polysaccharide pyruvyl transferase WcaK-like protein
MQKVLLINRGNTDNLGDKAISFTLKSLLEKTGLKVDFKDFIGEKDKPIDYFNEASLRLDKVSVSKKGSFLNSSIKRVIWLFKKASMFSICFGRNKVDMVFIGGGQLINSNIYFPVAMFLWVTLFKSFSKTKVVLFGVGSESEFGRIDRWLYRSALKRADQIYVRDFDSQQVLTEIFGVSAEYTPDVVYGIKQFIHSDVKKTYDKALIGPTSLKRLYKHSNKFNVGSDSDFWEELILNFRNKDYVVELFYTTVEDLVECIKVQKSIKLKYKIDINIAMIQTVEELISVISSSQIVVSQRMHALILGHIYGCMLDPILISEKLVSFKKYYLDDEKVPEQLSVSVEMQLANSLNRVSDASSSR